MPFHTADLCDRYEDQVRAGTIRVVEPMFNPYGGKDSFHGPIATLKVFEDNTLVRAALEQPGNGRVLVIDGGGSRRCALVGDQLAALAVRNGWAGIVVYGCVRDAHALGDMDIGILALATHPLKSIKKGAGDAGIAVTFGGVVFRPDEYLYADRDGVLVSPEALL
ncbi:MAG: ribonuclease E activity regulator RraA [Pseudomonadota bacterium]